MKLCGFCHRELPLDQFYRDKRGVLSSRCKGCQARWLRTCVACGATFIGRRNRKLCSDRCRKIWRPRAVLTCEYCGAVFHTDHLRRRYCSFTCKSAAMVLPAVERKPRLRATPEARRAQGLVRYYISISRMKRPNVCSECGAPGPVDAAHADYAKPLLVRWLCRSCHVLWDKRDPKGGCLRGTPTAA